MPMLIAAAICFLAYFIAAIVVLASTDSWIQGIKEEKLTIYPDTDTYPGWKDLPNEIVFSATFWHVSNPTEVVEEGAKPHLTEMGPYVYHQKPHKTRLVWNDENGTVTYRHMSTYHFQEHLSRGPESDYVVTLNGVIAGANRKVILGLKNANEIETLINTYHEQLFVNHTVREMLFDGFEDGILDAIRAENPSAPERFAYKFKSNGTDDGEPYNVFTGKKVEANPEGLSKRGLIANWNYNWYTGFYPGDCGVVKGFDGLFAPGMTKDPVYYFFYDLCGAHKLDFVGEKDYEGLKVHKYRMGRKMLANGKDNTENECYVLDDVTRPSGVFDSSPCKSNLPLFFSQPHFYQGAKYFASKMAGGALKPNKAKHETVFLVDPVSGVALQVNARLQVNFYLNSHPDITLFRNLPQEMYVPTVWFESAYVAEEGTAEKLLKLRKVAGYFTGIGVVLLLCSFAFAAAVGLHFWNERQKRHREAHIGRKLDASTKRKKNKSNTTEG